ncbi:MAG: DUF5011 domain-containing protein, partial [Bacteroidetes bacterium]|nr:DUF5011 domain-containing protein [Bacteroidota bacterium]
ETYTELGATASDNCDAAVTVEVGGDTVDPAVTGTYIITYDATDDSGNVAEQVTRIVQVVDTSISIPVHKLSAITWVRPIWSVGIAPAPE